MSDRGAFALAGCAALGAFVSGGPPVPFGVALLIIVLVLRRPWLLCLAALALTGGRAAADQAGLLVAPRGPFAGWVTLTQDPITDPTGAVVASVRAGEHLAEATARGDGGPALLEREAGDRIEVRGTLRAVPPGSTWLARRHIAARLVVDAVLAWDEGSTPSRVANATRDALARSARVLPERQRGLYLGLVLGDDREEPADIADDFLGAGLSHLLAVSGQNVAFVLALTGPALRRMRLNQRFVTTVAILGLFVLVTRAEPSVLRAAAMAAIAALAHAMGREGSGLRVLALAVTGLLIADPFLIDAVGFQLSIAASAAILVLAHRIARAIPGPRAVAEAIAVSVAAQAGVAPVLIAVFGGVPVAGLLANVLAAPAAGPVMAWGVLAGLIGGVLGPGVSSVLHTPTSLLIAWLAGVARWTARLPLGELGAREVIVLAGAVALLLLARRRGLALLRISSSIVAITAVLAPAAALQRAPERSMAIARGATLWRAGATVLVVDGRAEAPDVLAGLRRAGIEHLDLLIERRPGPSELALVAAVQRRAPATELLVPASVAGTIERHVGRLVITIERHGDGLTVEVVDPNG